VCARMGLHTGYAPLIPQQIQEAFELMGISCSRFCSSRAQLTGNLRDSVFQGIGYRGSGSHAIGGPPEGNRGPTAGGGSDRSAVTKEVICVG
jgi:hypothetical protein